MIIPVLVLFMCFSILFLNDKQDQSYKKKKPILFFTIVILTFIAAFRPEDMADRENYLDFWNDWGGERFEIGFTFLSELIRKISDSFYWFLFFFAFFSISLKINAICKITTLIWGSIILYLSNIFILHDMIQMRCAIASGFLLHAVYYIGMRNLKKFLLVSFFAMLFHYSAIIVLPLWFLNIHKPHKYFYIGLIFISYILGGIIPIETIIGYIPIEGIQNLWDMYETTVDSEINIFNAMQLGRTLIVIYLLLTIDRISLYNPFAILLVQIYAISVIALVLLSSVPVVAFRVSELYQIVEIAIVPMAIYSIKGNSFVKRMAVVLVATAFILMNIFYVGILK